MAELSFRSLLTGGIIFSMLVMFVFYTIYLVERGSIEEDRSVTLQTASPGFVQNDELNKFNRSFNRMGETEKEIGDVRTNLSRLTPTSWLSVATLPLAFISVVWNSVKTILGMFGFLDAIFKSLTGWWGIPSWIINLIILLISIVLIFGIINLIFGRQE